MIKTVVDEVKDSETEISLAEMEREGWPMIEVGDKLDVEDNRVIRGERK